jgi:hypothetical protein
MLLVNGCAGTLKNDIYLKYVNIREGIITIVIEYCLLKSLLRISSDIKQGSLYGRMLVV